VSFASDDSAATTELAIAAVRRHARAGMSVLDAGCGDGAVAAAALALGAQVRAIDRSAEAIACARARGVPAEWLEIERTDGQYDVVVANLWVDDLLRLARPIRELVRPGGILIATGNPLWRARAVVVAFAPLQALHIDACRGWCGVLFRRGPC
jgi:ribosomal protein L11 methyltransferase